MKILLRLLWVVIIAALGWFGYALTANLLVVTGLVSSDTVAAQFGVEMTHKAMIVLLLSLPIAIGSVFMQSKLRYVLLFAPLYAPSLFALFYALANAGTAAPVAG